MPPKIKISSKFKEQIFKRDKFKCQKCGFLGLREDLTLHYINEQAEHKNKPDNLITLCLICNTFAPKTTKEFQDYLNEKIDGNILGTFRKYQKPDKIKQGMAEKFSQGNLMTRPPLGYKIENKKLLPDNNAQIVDDIFQTFLYKNLSLTQLANRFNLSVNGLKKILTNYTYLGKIKFDGQIIDSTHPPLISAEIFNKAQDKLKEKGIKRV